MGETEVISLLLDHGAKLDCRDPSGRTALEYCVAFGHVPAVLILLGRGADPNAEDDHGEQELLCAVVRNIFV